MANPNYFAGIDMTDRNAVSARFIAALDSGNRENVGAAAADLYDRLVLAFKSHFESEKAKWAAESVARATAHGEAVSNDYEAKIAKYLAREDRVRKDPRQRLILNPERELFRETLDTNRETVKNSRMKSSVVEERIKNASNRVTDTSAKITKLENQLLVDSAEYLAWKIILEEVKEDERQKGETNKQLKDVRRQERELKDLKKRLRSGGLAPAILGGPAPMAIEGGNPFALFIDGKNIPVDFKGPIVARTPEENARRLKSARVFEAGEEIVGGVEDLSLTADNDNVESDDDEYDTTDGFVVPDEPAEKPVRKNLRKKKNVIDG